MATSKNVDDSHASATLRSTTIWRPPSAARAALILVVLGLCWRVLVYGLAMPIWGDESFIAVDFVLRGFAGMLDPLTYGQIAPPGYLWLVEAASRVWGYSEYALRLPAFIAGVIAIFAFWHFAWRTLPVRPAMLAVAFFASSYYIVRHTAEAKPYGTDLFFSLLIMIAGWAVFQKPTAWPRWLGLILLGIVAPWCSYPSIFVAGTVGLILTWKLYKSGITYPWLAGWLIFALTAGFSILTLYVLVIKPHSEFAAGLVEYELWKKTFPPFDRPWMLPLWFLYIHTGPMFAYPQGGSPPASVVTFLFCIIGGLYLFRRNRDLFWLLVGPFVLTFIAAAMKAYPYGGSPRVAQHVAPAICMLAGVGLFALLRALLRGVHFRRSLWIAPAVFGIFIVAGMIEAAAKPYKSEAVLRSQNAVLHVAKLTDRDDRWITFNAKDPVDYAPWLGDWWGVGGQFVFDALRFAPVELTWAPPPDEVKMPEDGDLWLLIYWAKHPKFDFPHNQLDAYVQSLAQRFGEPEYESYPIKDTGEGQMQKLERLDVYRFNGREDVAPTGSQ